MKTSIKSEVVERHQNALKLIEMHQLLKALLRSAVVELVDEYIDECETQEGVEYWSKCSVEEHVHDFGLYVEYSTE